MSKMLKTPLYSHSINADSFPLFKMFHDGSGDLSALSAQARIKDIVRDDYSYKINPNLFTLLFGPEDYSGKINYLSLSFALRHLPGRSFLFTDSFKVFEDPNRLDGYIAKVVFKVKDANGEMIPDVFVSINFFFISNGNTSGVIRGTVTIDKITHRGFIKSSPVISGRGRYYNWFLRALTEQTLIQSLRNYLGTDVNLTQGDV